MLSEALESDLAAARAHQLQYKHSKETARAIRDKILVMLVSPVAVGKSFVVSEMIKNDDDFAPVAVVTTRDARPDDDPTLFRTVPHDDRNVADIVNAIQNGKMVNYTIHPTSGRIYGTFPSDYPGDYNILPTLSGAVAQLQNAAFKQTFVIALSTDPKTWKKRLSARYPASSEERTKRLKEAAVSLQWMLDSAQQSTVFWVDNPDESATAVQSVVDIVKYNKQGNPVAKENARLMLEILEELL